MKSIGTKPDALTYDKSQGYWNMFWYDKEKEDFLQLKLGGRLAQRNAEGKVVLVVWVRFNHEVSGRTRIYPWSLDEATDVIDLIQNCQYAIEVLRMGDTVP